MAPFSRPATSWLSQSIRPLDSDNGGIDWHPDQLIGTTPVTRGNDERWEIPAQPDRGILTVPSLAIAQTGPFAGRLFAAYTISPLGRPDSDIQVAWTDNPSGSAGSWNFTVPHVVTTNSQFHPWIETDPMTGVPYVSWLDANDSGSANNTVRKTGTFSIDGGVTWLPPIILADAASDQSAGNPNRWNPANYLEYNTPSAFGGMAFDVWPDNSNSTGNNPSGTADLDIYTDRVILAGHVITVTGTAGPDTYHVQMDTSGQFVKIWENTDPVGTPTFTMHKDALKGLIFDLIAGVDVIFVAPEVLDYLSAPGKFLDAGDNYMIVDYTGPSSPITSLQSLLKSGRNNGTWDGNGIRSAAAANDPNDETALGYAEADELGLSEFAGQAVDDTSILVKYTFYGDTDLNGNVNLTDFNRLAANFGMTGRLWFQGDFNYDTIVNLADFNLLAGNFGQSGLGPGGGGGTYGYTVWDLRYHLLHGGHGLPPR